MLFGRKCRTEPARAARALYVSLISGGPINTSEVLQILDGYGAFESYWVPSKTECEINKLPEGMFVRFAYFLDSRDAYLALRDHAKYRFEHRDPGASKNRTHTKPSCSVRPDLYTVRLGNLPYDITEQELDHIFQSFGQVEAVHIVYKAYNNDQFYGVFAYVEFRDIEGAWAAYVNEGNKLVIRGYPVHVEWKKGRTSPHSRWVPQSPDMLKRMHQSVLAPYTGPVYVPPIIAYRAEMPRVNPTHQIPLPLPLIHASLRARTNGGRYQAVTGPQMGVVQQAVVQQAAANPQATVMPETATLHRADGSEIQQAVMPNMAMMPDLAGMANMQNMQNMPNMPNVPNMQNMATMQNIMPNMQNMANMQNIMPNMPQPFLTRPDAQSAIQSWPFRPEDRSMVSTGFLATGGAMGGVYLSPLSNNAPHLPPRPELLPYQVYPSIDFHGNNVARDGRANGTASDGPYSDSSSVGTDTASQALRSYPLSSTSPPEAGQPIVSRGSPNSGDVTTQPHHPSQQGYERTGFGHDGSGKSNGNNSLGQSTTGNGNQADSNRQT
ncbi:hypothetical protein LTR66_007533 [Elasticomyces elasticus]|nr:hypothetical protein LTR66_007533 [Elasticomyces elasticus]